MESSIQIPPKRNKISSPVGTVNFYFYCTATDDKVPFWGRYKPTTPTDQQHYVLNDSASETHINAWMIWYSFKKLDMHFNDHIQLSKSVPQPREKD